MSMSPMEITLERDGHNQPWGFRLQGGQDVGVVLSIQRILCGTPSEGVLRKGDIVCKIGNFETKSMSHQAAVDKFTNAGNQVSVVIKRVGASAPAPSAVVQGPAPVPKTPPVSGGVALPGMTPPITTSNKNPLVNLSKSRSGLLPAAPRPIGAYNLTLQTQVTGSLQQIQNQGSYCIATEVLDPVAAPVAAPFAAPVSAPFVVPLLPSSPAPVAHSPIPIPRQSPAQNLYQSSPPVKVSSSPVPMAGNLGAQQLQGGLGAQGAQGAQGAPKVYNNPIGLYSKENIKEVAKLNMMGTNPGKMINPSQNFGSKIYQPTAPVADELSINKPPKHWLTSGGLPRKYDPEQSATWQAINEQENCQMVTEHGAAASKVYSMRI